MKALKVLTAILFVVVVVGAPAAYLLTSTSGDAVVSTPINEPANSSQSGSGGLAMPAPAYCDTAGVNAYGTCDYPRVNPIDYSDQRPLGVERFVLLGETSYDSPGNATTSFLMVFFGLCAVVAGAVLAFRRTRWLSATALTASGVALFLSAQILWNGGDAKQWVVGLAFLSLNLAVLLALGFLIFKDAETRRGLTIGIAGAVIASTVLVQSAIFYDLIGTPDSGTYSTPEQPIMPMPGTAE